MIRKSGLVATLSFLLCACGPTHQEVADEYKQRILNKKQQVIAAAKLLQEQDKTMIPACEETRIPLVWSYYGRGSNTTIAMHEWVLNLENPYHKIPFNLTSSHELEETIDWVSDPNPRDMIKDETAEEGFRERFESVSGLKYIVFNQVNHFEEPRLLSSESFLPGSVAVTMYVLSLIEPGVLCKAEFSAGTPDKVTSYQFSDFPDITQGNFAIRSALFDAARKAQLNILKKVSNRVE